MKKIFLKNVVVLAIIIFSFFSFFSLTKEAFAYSTFGGQLLNGVGNWGKNTQYYYIDSSASTDKSLIDSSMYSWVHTGSILSTAIYFVYSTNKSSSMIEVHKGSYFAASNNIVGHTWFYNGTTEVDPSTVSTYEWAKIGLNNPNYDQQDSYNKQETIAHEMGHAFGLAHNTLDSKDLMWWQQNGTNRNTPAYDDLNGINSLY